MLTRKSVLLLLSKFLVSTRELKMSQPCLRTLHIYWPMSARSIKLEIPIMRAHGVSKVNSIANVKKELILSFSSISSSYDASHAGRKRALKKSTQVELLSAAPSVTRASFVFFKLPAMLRAQARMNC